MKCFQKKIQTATFVLTLKSFSAFSFQSLKIPAFFLAWLQKTLMSQPCSLPAWPSTLSFTVRPLPPYSSKSKPSPVPATSCYFRSCSLGAHSEPALVPSPIWLFSFRSLRGLFQFLPTGHPSFQVCSENLQCLGCPPISSSFFLLCLLFQALKLRAL